MNIVHSQPHVVVTAVPGEKDNGFTLGYYRVGQTLPQRSIRIARVTHTPARSVRGDEEWMTDRTIPAEDTVYLEDESLAYLITEGVIKDALLRLRTSTRKNVVEDGLLTIREAIRGEEVSDTELEDIRRSALELDSKDVESIRTSHLYSEKPQ